jgi:predicted dehydrogenase
VVRVGLVGCGNIGRAHSWALWAVRKAGHADVRITAVCDPDAERARDLAEPNKADVMELGSLLDSVDAVYVCTPTVHHLDVVRAASARGLPIYCEKPLGRSLEEAEAVAAELRKVTHRVGLVMRCVPLFETVADIVRSGRYGRPMVLVLRDDQYFPIQGQYASKWRSDVASAGGGTLIEHSIHDLDLFALILGDATDVSCRTHAFFGHDGIEDLATVTLTFPHGTTASLISVWHQVLTRGSSRRLEVFCEDAFLWTDNDRTGPLHIETTQGKEAIACPMPAWMDELPVPADRREVLAPYAEASRRFLDAIASRSAGSPGEGDAVAAHRMVDAAYRSAHRGGAPVSFLGDLNTRGGETS